MNEETPAVQDAETITPRAATAEEAKAIEAAKNEPGPAHELRQAQALIAGGLYPGQMAPAIVAAFNHIGKLAEKIELDYKHEQEFKARQKA